MLLFLLLLFVCELFNATTKKNKFNFCLIKGWKNWMNKKKVFNIISCSWFESSLNKKPSKIKEWQLTGIRKKVSSVYHVIEFLIGIIYIFLCCVRVWQRFAIQGSNNKAVYKWKAHIFYPKVTRLWIKN